jgi:hypothetical protein
MTARGRRLRTVAAIVLTMAAGTGCGGGPSAEETRAELRRWASAVDDVCRATREAIAARGEAHDARDLHWVAAGASEDVRAAIERIRRVRLSEAARPRVRSFLAELAKIEPRLSEMTRTTADGELNEIGDLGLRLADATKRFQDRAEAVGLRECGDATQFDAVLNAFTAPVYATQIARLEVWLARALRPLTASSPSPTSPDFARYLRRVGGVLEHAERRMDNLYVYRPNRAVEEADDLAFALDAFENVLNAVADDLRGGRRVLTAVGVKQFRREVVRRGRDVRRAITRLRTAIGARPLPVPGAQPLLEPETDTA